jgi:peptide/nickel transport system substrate-binding protein
MKALIKGDVDALDFVPPPAINALKNIPNIQIINGYYVRPTFTDIIINQMDARNCPPKGKCSGHPALRDLRVRQALAYGTDKQRIIQVSLQGMAVPGITVIPNGLGKWYNSDLSDYPFDIDQANKILDEAGYLDINNDGLREMPDHKTPLKFTLSYPADNPTYLYERLGQLLNETWSQLGIQLKLQPIKEGDLVSKVNPGFEHDIALWSWSVNPDPDFMLSVMTTNQILGGNSETGYSNPEYDMLYDQQSKELDINKRKDLIWKMQQIMLRDVVYIVAYYDQYAFAVRTDRFKGWPFGQKKVMPEYPGLLTKLEPVR